MVPERGHERRDEHLVDQEAVGQAGQRADQQSDHRGEDGRHAGEHELGGHYRGDADDGADGQVDAARQDDHGHAHRDDAHDRDLAQYVEDILRAEKDRRDQAKKHAECDQHDEDAVPAKLPLD